MPGPTDTQDAPGTAVLTEEVLGQVRDVLSDVIGEDYVTELDIDLETAFHADLEIESIEFIALGEVLQARYGERIDFAEWIATMDVDEIIAMHRRPAGRPHRRRSSAP